MWSRSRFHVFGWHWLLLSASIAVFACGATPHATTFRDPDAVAIPDGVVGADAPGSESQGACGEVNATAECYLQLADALGEEGSEVSEAGNADGLGPLDGHQVLIGFCQPCKADADCTMPGFEDAACVERGPEGRFCSVLCYGDRPCPDGYECASTEGHCWPAAGACPCTPEFRDGGFVTECYRENAHGRCTAERTCDQPCPAPEPAPEACDGVDNDCDAATDEDACDDGNPCTDDSCAVAADGAPPACKHVPNQAECTDGNQCTAADRCAGGVCIGWEPVGCDDQNPCTRDRCDPLAGCGYEPAQAACDDGNPCTVADSCVDEDCVGSGEADCDDGDPCTDDACAAGTGCAHSWNSAECDDGNPCTEGDACVEGTCVGGQGVCPCQSDAQCAAVDDQDLCNGVLKCDAASHTCEVDPASVVACDPGMDSACRKLSCVPVTGLCAAEAAPDGTPCNDGNACTAVDACAAGVCVGWPPVDCDDGNPCTLDACAPSSGCTHGEKDDATACDDGNPCTVGDRCLDGACLPDGPADCDDANVCTDDACEAPGGCRHTANASPCDDGEACTIGDACAEGTCVPGAAACQCLADGDCGKLEDGNPCNGTLRCNRARVPYECTVDPATVVVCDPGLDTACRKNTCDPGSGACGLRPVEDGVPCDDGNACTRLDACAAGWCAGLTEDCDDGNSCTTDSCDPGDPGGQAGGCRHEPRSGACEDGNTCTVGDRCADGACAPGPVPPEVCNGDDDDCDGQTDEPGAVGCTVFFADRDADGWGIAADSKCLCAKAEPYVATGTGDCDDADPAVNPGAQEACGGADEDCDGRVDEPGAAKCSEYLMDADGDGFGNDKQPRLCLCAPYPTSGYTTLVGGDCNDGDASVHPDAPESCNGKDDDCDGTADEPGALGCTVRLKDADEDGFGVTGDAQCLCTPAKPYTSSTPGDCDDADPTIRPSATEVCDGKDNDCNGIVDDPGATGCGTFFLDGDGDGFGVALNTKCLCGASAPYSATAAGDCADADPDVRPGATEVCNGKDDDCDGTSDPIDAPGCREFYEDLDHDGYGKTPMVRCQCGPVGFYSAELHGDCDDANAAANPGAAEDCKTAFDDDCDAMTQERDVVGCTAFFVDGDGDGFGAGEGQCWCAPNGSFKATKAGDCDDTKAPVFPGAAPICGSDSDCDGAARDAAEECDDLNSVAWDGCTACAITEFRVDPGTTMVEAGDSGQGVAAAPDGRFVVLWKDWGKPGFSVRGQAYGADGWPAGSPFAVNSDSGLQQGYPAVAMGADGRFAAAWEVSDNGRGDVCFRAFAADRTPVALEIRVATPKPTADDYRERPAIAVLSDGRSVVAWRRVHQPSVYPPGEEYDVHARVFDASGATAGAAFAVHGSVAGEQGSPTVAALPNGRFLVAWHTYQSPSGWTLSARRFQPDGAPEGPEFPVNTRVLTSSQVAVAAFPDGRHVVVWAGSSGQDAGIFARLYSADGAPEGPEFAVVVGNGQFLPSVAAIGSGGFVVAWRDDKITGVRGRRFDAAGNPLDGGVALGTPPGKNRWYPSVAAGTTHWVAVWQNDYQDTWRLSVFAQRFGADGSKLYR